MECSQMSCWAMILFKAMSMANPISGAIVVAMGIVSQKEDSHWMAKKYQLPLNDGENHLAWRHQGIQQRSLECRTIEEEKGPSLKLTYVSPDGEERVPRAP